MPRLTMPARGYTPRRAFSCAGVIMPPRVTLEADDLVTPAAAAKLLGVPASTVRTWIQRYRIEQLGTLGRWPAYDYQAIAAVEAARRTCRPQAA